MHQLMRSRFQKELNAVTSIELGVCKHITGNRACDAVKNGVSRKKRAALSNCIRRATPVHHCQLFAAGRLDQALTREPGDLPSDDDRVASPREKWTAGFPVKVSC